MFPKINKKTLLGLFGFLFLLGAILVWPSLNSQKQTIQPTNGPIITPTLPPILVTPNPSAKDEILNLLPVVTDNYTIEYFPVPQKFFVQILKNPFEKYQTEVKKWFQDHGVDSNDPIIVWGSVRGVAPKKK